MTPHLANAVSAGLLAVRLRRDAAAPQCSQMFAVLWNLVERSVVPEVIRYRIGADRADAFIRWDSAEGHLRGFRQSAQFREFFAHIKPYVGDILEMEHYESTGVTAQYSSC